MGGGHDHEHLKQLCKLMGLNDYSFKMIQSQMDGKADEGKDEVPWFEQMSQSELLKLHIIRALHNDPELLLLQRPVDECDADHAAKMLSVLRKFVDNRGVLTTAKARKLARPRTLFFSSGEDRERSETAADIADVVWHLSEQGFTEGGGGSVGQNTYNHGGGGNKIVTSWSKEARSLQADLAAEKSRYADTMEQVDREMNSVKQENSHAKTMLKSVRNELSSWERQEENKNRHACFSVSCIDRSATKTRINAVQHMIEKPGSGQNGSQQEAQGR
jgi:ATPase subunit of ABC transporter with duplicated ATPase domains